MSECCEEILIEQDYGGPGVVQSFSAGSTGFTPSVATTGDIVLAGKLNIAHGGTGADNATDALTNLGVPVFSLLNYGAVADGDGQGGGTDNTAALTAALTAAQVLGGIVLVPFSGTNIYNVSGQISGDFSNITIMGEGGSTLDVTNWLPVGTPTPDIDFSIQATGSLGAPLDLASQASATDTVSFVDASSISVGAILQFTSTINSLSADVRTGVWEPADVLKWRLGAATGSITGFVPFSEFATVKAVVGNTVTLTAPLKWKYPVVRVPSYGVTGLAVSCARVMTPVRNFWIKNLNFTRYDAAQDTVRGANIVQMIAAIDSGIVGGTYHLAQRRGAAGNFICCIDTVQQVRTTHTTGYDPSLQHDIYNSAKWKGCLRHKVVIDDINGSQGPDETYLSSTYAPYNTINMYSDISGKSEGNLDGWTSHGGSFGLKVHDFTAVNCGRVFYNRARYFSIDGIEGSNCTDPDDGALGFGAFGVDGSISNVNVYGAPRGIQIERKVLDEIAPPHLGLKFSDVNLYDITNTAAARLVEPTTESNAVTINVASPAVITQAGGTGIYYGCPVTFSVDGVGTLPTGLSLNTLYYVLTKLSDTDFTVSATVGGSAINTTAPGSGTHNCNWQSANADPCGVAFEGCNFIRVNTGVSAEAYANYVTWLGGSMELTGTNPIGFRGFANSIGHKVRGASFYDNDVAAVAIQAGNPTGTIGSLVFPTATYPTIRLDMGEYGSQTNTLVGLGVLTAINSTRGLYNFQAGTTYTFMLADVWQSVYCTRTTTSQTLTVALDGTGVGQIQWQDGAEIEIQVAVNAVGPTVAGAVGVTIDAPQGLVIPTGARGYLKRRGTDQWKLTIITSAQTIGASYIDVGAAIGGSDTLDFVPLLQAFYASSDAAGKHLIYRKSRAWVSPVKPTTGLGPQSQYLTPPQYSTHEWEPGALWDFSAYTTTGSVVYFRPADGVYGSPLSVVGTVGNDTNTITVGAGQAAGLKLGDRLLLCNTTALTTLVGAFTLVDGFGTQVAARAETVIVASVSGDVITTANCRRDTYDVTATPVLYPYQNEPRLKLINPTMLAPYGLNDHRAILFGSGRDFTIEGGTLTSFDGSYMVAVFGSLGGSIKDLTMFSTRTPGDAGGGIAICSDTSAYEVSNNRSYGGSQMIMMSASNPFYGITRDITIENNNIYNPSGGITTHNTHDHIVVKSNNIFNAADVGIDMRCPNGLVLGNYIENANTAMYFRINPNGLVVDGLVAKNCVSGIRLTDFSANWDYPPGNFTFKNIKLENIGGTASSGGISLVYPTSTSGLGSVTMDNIDISMNNNSPAIEVGGAWPSPKISGFRPIAADGASPAGRSVLMDGAGNGAGNGPRSPFIQVTQSATYAVPSTTDFTGLVSTETGIEGRTTSRLRILTTATTLISEEGNTAPNTGAFINTGATALVEVTLPLASSPRFQEFTFTVVDADGFKIIAQTGDTFQIGSGAPGASGGSLTSTTIGAWVRVWAVTSVKWIAEVDDPANWVLA